MRLLLIKCFALVCISCASWATAATNIAMMDKVAVLIYPQSGIASGLQRSAQTRLENILLDNGLTVLDQDKANELKDVWKQLEDPGFLITAESFVENAGQYNVDGLLVLYLTADSANGLANTFTATAQADLRFVGADAKVKATTTSPMGAPGNPASDGVTAAAAVVNAVQRAVDIAASSVGLEVVDFAKPRSINFSLEPSDVTTTVRFGKPREQLTKDEIALASLKDETWLKESATCSVKALSGSVAAVAGYIRDTDLGRQPQRLYGSVVHVLALDEKKELNAFETASVSKRAQGEYGTSQVLDCDFIYNWRYLAAVTGNYLFLWDIERGQELAKISIPDAPKKASLLYKRIDDQDVLLIGYKKEVIGVYSIVRSQESAPK